MGMHLGGGMASEIASKKFAVIGGGNRWARSAHGANTHHTGRRVYAALAERGRAPFRECANGHLRPMVIARAQPAKLLDERIYVL